MIDETETDVAAETPGESSDKPAKAKKPPKPPKPPKVKKAKTAKQGGFNMLLVLVPVALIAAIVLAVTLPPTHALLAKGPLKPLFARFDKPPAGKGMAKAIDPAADVKALTDTVATERKAAQAKDAQIAQLQAQVTQLQAPVQSSPTPAPKPTPVVISDDVKRAASYWSGMDADKAAEIVKALPDAYVEQVFSQMPADAVSDIMSALPAKTAARLTVAAPPDTP